MKLYLNDDTEGIDIITYSHNYTYVPEQSENYSIELDITTDINLIDEQYGNVIINKLVVKNHDTIVRNLSNLNLKISSIQDRVNEYNPSVYIYLSTSSI